MKTRTMALVALIAILLTPGLAAAHVFFSFGTLRAPIITPVPCPLGGVYGAPAYYPSPYAYPYYAVPAVPYGYPLGYRGAWRTDYPWWSPGPRGYRWH